MREFEKINKFFIRIYSNTTNIKHEDPLPYPPPDNNKNATNCGALNRNMLAVSVASLLYEGKTKAQIFDVVNFLHLLIALSKSY